MSSSLPSGSSSNDNNDMKPKLVASRIAIGLFGTMAVIQVAIAVGILPVTIVWGGSQKQRTWQNSLASAVAAVILVGMAWIIHARATTELPSVPLRTCSWIIAVYMMLNTLGNFASTSWVERNLFGSLTIVLAICSVVVSCSAVTGLPNGNHVERNHYESI